MSKSGMLAAVATAAGLDASQPVTLTADLVAEHFPGVAADLAKRGAETERTRIAAIDAAALPGHEGLVAAYKADGTKTAGDLALAIIGEEKKARAAQLGNLEKDEQQMRGLRSQPANGSEPERPANPLAGLSGEALWKAEFAQSEDVRAEFTGNEQAYVSFRKAETEGRARIFNKAKA
jgi:hypothetical protein